MQKGFTLIELIVVIAIIAVLSGIILFSIAQYINKGKDSNIASNLSVLVPAGEVYYNNHSSSYTGFCDLDNSVIANAVSQMPKNPQGACHESNDAGLCCAVGGINDNEWAACATRFADQNSAYCVDSRGAKKEISNDQCITLITLCP